MEIFVENHAGELYLEQYGQIAREAVNAALTSEGVTENAEVSVTITLDEEMRRLNKKYRRLDEPTDVLSFPMFASRSEISAAAMAGMPVTIGDIVISIEKAVSQAERFAHSVERELAFLAAHGALHLLGYDHLTEADEAVMIEKQEAILRNYPRIN